MKLKRTQALGYVPLLFACLGLGWAATPSPTQTPPIRAESNLVLLRFHAINRDHYLDDLRVDEIEVLENGKRREISIFEGPSTATRSRSVHLILALDVSGSATPYRPLTSSLLRVSVISALDQNAQLSLYSFAAETRHLAGPTRDTGFLEAGLANADKLNTRGSAVFDAVREICQKLEQGKECRNVLIVFSDGKDTTGATADHAIRSARDVETKIYAVVLGHHFSTESTENRAASFARLASETGGRTFDPLALDSNTLRNILETVVFEQNLEYLVGYYLQREARAAKRKIRVNLVDRTRGKIRGGQKELVF